MKFTESLITKLSINCDHVSDTVSVYLENLGNGKGKVIIEVGSESWSSYWPSMGSDVTIESFILRCDNHYLSKNLRRSDEVLSEYDFQKFLMNIKKSITSNRINRFIGKGKARRQWNSLGSLILNKDWFDDPENGSFIADICGCDFQDKMSYKDSSFYIYMCHILNGLKECLAVRIEQNKTLSEGK